MENLYKEAIADAKALRASAMANAKAALEEAFEPQLREMFRKTVEEADQIEEDEDLTTDAEDAAENLKEIDEIEEIEESEDAEQMEETMDETSLEEILGELEALANEGEDHEEAKSEEEYTEDGMEEGQDDMNYEAKSEEDGEEDAEEDEDSEEGMEDHEAEETESEEDTEKVITITLGQLKDILSPYQADEEGAEDAEGEEATDDINLDEIFSELEEAAKVKKDSVTATTDGYKKIAKGKKEMEEQEQLEVPGTEKQLKEANQTIGYLQTQLKEVNLLNAKYLFMNKLFKGKSLTESQKLKAINAFDRATTVKEVKNTFATLSESFSTIQKKSINEGFASQAVGIAPKRTETIESDPFISRMQKLAGIK
jgi:hypothetical protein